MNPPPRSCACELSVSWSTSVRALGCIFKDSSHKRKCLTGSHPSWTNPVCFHSMWGGQLSFASACLTLPIDKALLKDLPACNCLDWKRWVLAMGYLWGASCRAVFAQLPWVSYGPTHGSARSGREKGKQKSDSAAATTPLAKYKRWWQRVVVPAAHSVLQLHPYVLHCPHHTCILT